MNSLTDIKRDFLNSNEIIRWTYRSMNLSLGRHNIGFLCHIYHICHQWFLWLCSSTFPFYYDKSLLACCNRILSVKMRFHMRRKNAFSLYYSCNYLITGHIFQYLPLHVPPLTGFPKYPSAHFSHWSPRVLSSHGWSQTPGFWGSEHLLWPLHWHSVKLNAY